MFLEDGFIMRKGGFVAIRRMADVQAFFDLASITRYPDGAVCHCRNGKGKQYKMSSLVDRSKGQDMLLGGSQRFDDLRSIETMWCIYDGTC